MRLGTCEGVYSASAISTLRIINHYSVCNRELYMCLFFLNHMTHKLVDSDYTIVSDSYHCVTLEQ